MTDKYLHFRLEKAGHQGRAIFDKSAIKRLTKYADGTLRRLNVLADKSLLAAFLQKSPVVEVKHVKLALKDNIKGHKKSEAFSYVALAFLFAACVFAAAYFLMPINNQGLTSEALPIGEESTENQALNLDQGSVDEKKDTVNQPSELNNLLQSRLSAFNSLVKSTSSAYTIRLMTESSRSTERVTRFIRSAFSPQTEDKIFVNKTPDDVYIVYYGEYANYSQAKIALANLAPGVRKYKPYIVNTNK